MKLSFPNSTAAIADFFSNPSLARAKRAIERRNFFEDIYLHEQILADSVRLDAYRAATQRHVTSDDYVVDVGTGTGVLAFFAAAKNPRKIYAVDHSKKMLSYARAAAEVNGIANLTFVASSSHKFRPEERIDVIVQDQMGIALFDEGMVEIILDVRDRCLKPGGRILPARFEFYLEPVQLLERECIPMIQEQLTHGLTFPPMPIAPERTYYFREIYPEDVEFLLCDPEPMFAFDLTTLTRDQLPKRFSVSKPIIRGGQRDGISMYFRTTFDDYISFSTGPDRGIASYRLLVWYPMLGDCKNDLRPAVSIKPNSNGSSQGRRNTTDGRQTSWVSAQGRSSAPCPASGCEAALHAHAACKRSYLP